MVLNYQKMMSIGYLWVINNKPVYISWCSFFSGQGLSQYNHKKARRLSMAYVLHQRPQRQALFCPQDI